MPWRFFCSAGSLPAVAGASLPTQMAGDAATTAAGTAALLSALRPRLRALLDFTADQEQEKNSQDRVHAHETEQSEYSVAG